MKIKEIKVFKSKGLVFAQFWSKFKNSTSGWSKTARALFQIYFLYRIGQIFVHIFAKNMKGWSDKSKIWCSEQSGRAEKNTRKWKFYPSSPSLCKYLPNIFLSPGYSKIFGAVFPRVCSTGPLTLSHPSARLSKFKLILVLLRWGFNSYPNIWKKVKLTKYVHPNISIWNNLNSRKWGPRYSFLNFPNP